jgi:hypothetical protein
MSSSSVPDRGDLVWLEFTHRPELNRVEDGLPLFYRQRPTTEK